MKIKTNWVWKQDIVWNLNRDYQKEDENYDQWYADNECYYLHNIKKMLQNIANIKMKKKIKIARL